MRPLFLPLGVAIVHAFPLQAAAQTVTPSVVTTALIAAQEGASALTLAEAIKLAFEGNPGLRAAMRDIDIATGINSAFQLAGEVCFNEDRTVHVVPRLQGGGKCARRPRSGGKERTSSGSHRQHGFV